MTFEPQVLMHFKHPYYCHFYQICIIQKGSNETPFMQFYFLKDQIGLLLKINGASSRGLQQFACLISMCVLAVY